MERLEEDLRLLETCNTVQGDEICELKMSISELQKKITELEGENA